MKAPRTGKWYVIADKKTRWGSFSPENLYRHDIEIQPGLGICFWHKVRAVTGEQSWEVSVEGSDTCFVRDIPLEALAEFQYPELTPGKLYQFESKNREQLSKSLGGGVVEVTRIPNRDVFFVVRKVEGYNGEQWEVIYEGELFVLSLDCTIPVEVSDDDDF